MPHQGSAVTVASADRRGTSYCGMSVSESLGSPVFHLQQVSTPPWAVGDQMFAPELLPEDHRLLNEQLSEIHVAAQEALRWAITEVKGNIWLDD